VRKNLISRSDSSHRRAGNKTQNGSAALQTIVLPGTRQRRKRSCRRPGEQDSGALHSKRSKALPNQRSVPAGAIDYYQTGDPTQFQQGSAGFLLGTLGARATVTALNRANISYIFKTYPEAGGFSGAISRATGEIIIRPSQMEAPLPPGYVAQFTGHLIVSRLFSPFGLRIFHFQRLHRGFYFTRQPGGSLGMGWNSGQLNGINRGIAPCWKPRVNKAVSRATGANVFDLPPRRN
jgi:hypothetical protein